MWRLPGALRSCTTLVGGVSAAAAAKHTRCEDANGGFEEDFGFGDGGGDGALSASGPLKAPGQFEHWDGEVRRLTSVHAFKGCKMDVSKVLTPNFVLRHSVQLGDSPANPQANEHYSFMAQVYNDNGVMMSTLDQYGTLEAQLIVPKLPFNERMASKLILYLSGQQDMFWHDVEYAGRASNTQFRWGSNVMGWQGKMCSFGYTQAVTPALHLGAEAGLMNDLATPTSAATFKLDRPQETWIGTLKSHGAPVAAGDIGSPELSVHYHRKVVKDRVNLAASLSAQPLAGHASSSFGAEFALHQSTVSTAFHPSQGKVSTVVASKLSQGISLSVSADAIFGQQDPQSGALSDAFKFGYGLSLG